MGAVTLPAPPALSLQPLAVPSPSEECSGALSVPAALETNSGEGREEPLQPAELFAERHQGVVIQVEA